jgi:hypothetical protein
MAPSTLIVVAPGEQHDVDNSWVPPGWELPHTETGPTPAAAVVRGTRAIGGSLTRSTPVMVTQAQRLPSAREARELAALILDRRYSLAVLIGGEPRWGWANWYPVPQKFSETNHTEWSVTGTFAVSSGEDLRRAAVSAVRDGDPTMAAILSRLRGPRYVVDADG